MEPRTPSRPPSNRVRRGNAPEFGGVSVGRPMSRAALVNATAAAVEQQRLREKQRGPRATSHEPRANRRLRATEPMTESDG